MSHGTKFPWSDEETHLASADVLSCPFCCGTRTARAETYAVVLVNGDRPLSVLFRNPHVPWDKLRMSWTGAMLVEVLEGDEDIRLMPRADALPDPRPG